MTFRAYDHHRDREAALRIWYETGWIDPERPDKFDVGVQAGRALVAELEGEAECLVLSATATLRYLDDELPFSGVTGVTTSRIGRRQGLAARLTARCVAEDAAAGAAVSGLGIFDQGFYNKLGYGCGGYEHWHSVDPLRLQIRTRPRRPVRLGKEDWKAVHACRVARAQRHGGLSFHSPYLTRAALVESKDGFGLGFYDNGELTHHLWAVPQGGNRGQGPYRIYWLAYRTAEQLRELLGLLGSLGDQVLLVSFREPPDVQIQDLLDRPFRGYGEREKAKYETGNRARAYWQMRICDLERCLSKLEIPGEPVAFNLSLNDPIESLLDGDSPWKGLSGEYVVTFGAPSGARSGSDPSLPTLRAGIGAFTRLWLGVLPASGLAITDELSGPPELLARLDRALRLPQPRPDWDF